VVLIVSINFNIFIIIFYKFPSKDSSDYRKIFNLLQIKDSLQDDQDLMRNFNLTKNLDETERQILFNKVTYDFLNREGDEFEALTRKITSFVTERLSEIIEFNYYYDQHSNYFSSKSVNNIKYKESTDGFLLKKIPSISIEQYLQRLMILTGAELSTIMIMIILLERLTYNFKYKISVNNIHLLLFTAFIIAIKMNEDKIFNNIDFAQYGGINANTLHKLEIEFLNRLEFRTFVSPFVFYTYSLRFLHQDKKEKRLNQGFLSQELDNEKRVKFDRKEI
jgi:hypothetical protein